MPYILAIVGRPNVGKSTLYNRLIGERKAIVDDTSGVTRDRQYGTTNWNGRDMTVIDTGGFVKGSTDVFEAAIRDQVTIAMEEADIILFLTDVTTGITDMDESIARMLRGAKKPVVLAVNKADNSQRMLIANEFWALGFDNTFFISSMTGSGTGDLLDAVTDLLPAEENQELTEGEIPKFAIIGQPNVGKSSFVNALMGENRNIVTEIAGTTRDSIHSHYKKFGKEFVLIDTAGIRKKSKVHENLEFYSVIRAVKAIEEADVCLLLLDAKEGIQSQDMSIFSLVIKRKRGIVILVNKWDLIEKETNTAKQFEETLREKLAPFNDIPILFISVLDKQRIFKAMEKALEVAEIRRTKIKTSVLNDFLQKIMEKQSPPSHRGKFVKIKYVTQLRTYYPSFAFFCNHPKYIKASYKQYIENQLRKEFDLTGVPISIYFREK